MARFLIGWLRSKKSIHCLGHSIGCENLVDVIMIPCGPGPDITLANKATLTRVQYAGQIEPKYKLFYGVRSGIAQENRQWIYKKHFKTGYRQFGFVYNLKIIKWYSTTNSLQTQGSGFASLRAKLAKGYSSKDELLALPQTSSADML